MPTPGWNEHIHSAVNGSGIVIQNKFPTSRENVDVLAVVGVIMHRDILPYLDQKRGGKAIACQALNRNIVVTCF